MQKKIRFQMGGRDGTEAWWWTAKERGPWGMKEERSGGGGLGTPGLRGVRGHEEKKGKTTTGYTSNGCFLPNPRVSLGIHKRRGTVD